MTTIDISDLARVTGGQQAPAQRQPAPTQSAQTAPSGGGGGGGILGGIDINGWLDWIKTYIPTFISAGQGIYALLNPQQGGSPGGAPPAGDQQQTATA